MRQQGILIVVSGPSGTGKGTICQQLLGNRSDLQYSISATTRAPREGEVHGKNYWFLTRDEFLVMRDQGDLLEWAEVYGNFYGTPKPYVLAALESGKSVVLEIDTQGAMQIKKDFPDGVYVYILPPSFEALAERIRKRGTEEEPVIQRRLQAAEKELAYVRHYDYMVINDLLNAAVQELDAIITAEQCRVIRNEAALLEIIGTGFKGGNKE